MGNTSNVTAAKPGISGAFRIADYGTTLPTAADEELDDAFKTMGYISEDGYTETKGITSSSTSSWSGDTIFSGETARTDKIKVKYMEALNAEVCKFVFGDDNVTVDSEGRVTEIHCNNIEHAKKSIVIDEVLKGGIKQRTVVANANITEMSEIPHKAGEPIAYEPTIECVADPKMAHEVDGETVNDTSVKYIKYPTTTTANTEENDS